MKTHPAPHYRPSFERIRLRLEIRGVVQGVGFRPHVYRLAHQHELAGFVRNQAGGVCLEVEGAPERIERFAAVLVATVPAPSRVSSMERFACVPHGDRSFRIVESTDGPACAHVLPDQATCDACLAELSDTKDRRYRYPFINCTVCGPRFTIVNRAPYDRANTTMAGFPMCRSCRDEYMDPSSRRHHAQANACPACGPRAALCHADGRVVASEHAAIVAAAELLRQGAVIAVKGLGGYHLMVRASDPFAVARLRARKARGQKPFAVMCPDLQYARGLCAFSPLEERLLQSPAAPIVLSARHPVAPTQVADEVAPQHPDLGILLPYTPLHHLLLAELGDGVVATSGNLAHQPICADDRDALDGLSRVADAFLIHDRPIARACEDSLVRVMADQPVVLRRARGYAPGPAGHLPGAPSALAVGGHLKGAVAAVLGEELVLGPYIGDLDTEGARRRHAQGAEDLLARCGAELPQGIVADCHPDYGSRPLAEALCRRQQVPLCPVQHHVAHLFGCLVDNQAIGRLHGASAPAPTGTASPADQEILGVVWDGMGLSLDGRLWGGEFFVVTDSGTQHVGQLRSFRLMGGDAAARDGRRAALGVLHAMYGSEAFAMTDLAPVAALSPSERRVFRHALARGGHAPATSSAGRLFDAVAALLGVCLRSDYEGEAACRLEFLARGARGAPTAYPFALEPDASAGGLRVDWGPMIEALLADQAQGVDAASCAARFHAGLAEAIARVADHFGCSIVALTGGCFQNPTLLEGAVRVLRAQGRHAIWNREIPPNDGGLAAGQLAAFAGLTR
ncbi:MAG: carbamoyltransferase HypF [Myxococcales bacterium]|nr:carbamoyltransferase HypF [Myxococcales bacterium]MDD9967364.1 carbamoyltransferase HypF [Myxococcales bacterium]